MSIPYQGDELSLFAHAHHWKRYASRALAPYINGRVLEVGSGIGSNIALYATAEVTAWVGLEPDAELAEQARATLAEGRLGDAGRIETGTVAALDPAENFDTILYIDVLEHIEDDDGELARAAGHLAKGGHLIVLAPAHQSLYSAFDRAIGHYRRYDLSSLTALQPPGCAVTRRMMLDSVGLLASWGNRFVLAQSMPSETQIAFWDRVLVPLSRLVDPLTMHRLGKTVVVVWQKA